MASKSRIEEQKGPIELNKPTYRHASREQIDKSDKMLREGRKNAQTMDYISPQKKK
jgi:hypothetical protein